MGIAQIWRMLWAKRLVILIGMLVGAVAAVFVYRSIPAQYTATARVIMNLVRPDPVTGEAVSPAAAKAYVQAQTEVATDYRVASAVVDDFGWMTNPDMRRAYEASGRQGELDYRHWLAEVVSDSTSTDLVDNSNILEVSFTSTVPETARRAATAVRNAYIDQTLTSKRESAANNARWFRRQAASLKKNLAAAESRKAAFERANGIVLQDDNTDTEAARLRAIASAAPPVAAVMPGIAAAPAPSSSQLATIDAQIAAARATLGPNHPELQALQQQRQAIAAAVARETAAARAATRPAASGPSQASLIDAQTRKVLAQRGLVGEAQRLAGEVTVLRDQVAKTTQRAADFELQAQTTDVGLEPLGGVALPAVSSKASMWLFLIGGVGAGIGLGCVLALLLELLFRRVRGPEDLEAEGLPVLGIMPPSGAKRPRGLLEWLGWSRPRTRRVVTA